jgi:transcriptional regulator NrdR family protein
MRLRDPEVCRACQADSRVVNSRRIRRCRVRRRECVQCGHRWTTYESLINPESIRFRDPANP